MAANEVRNLDDREVLLVLSHLTDELGTETAVQTEDDARAAIEAFVSEFGGHQIDLDHAVRSEAEGVAVGREMLASLLEDADTRDATRSLVENPPEDEQMSIELAIAGAVVLGALITWLQTKVDVEVVREGGETSFRFHVHKDAADPGLIRSVSATIGKLFGA